MILCGWNERGRGKVMELELDFKGGFKDFGSFEKEWDKKERPTVSWSVEFKKRVLDLAWGPFKRKIYILMEDGGIRYAGIGTGDLSRSDFKSLSWKGGYPEKILGSPYDLKIEFGRWAGWPFGGKGRLLLREWTQSSTDMLVFPKKYYVLGMGGGKVWIDGVWENPALKGLRFLGLPLKAGQKSFRVSGVVGEPFAVFSFEKGRKVLVGKGRIGEKGIYEIRVPGGLRFGSPYWVVGPAYRVLGNYGTIAAPVLEGGRPFCAGKIGVSEWSGPLPENVFAGSKHVRCEVEYTIKGRNSMEGVKAFVLIGPQVKKNSPPLMNAASGKTLVRPWWIGEMKAFPAGEDALEGRIAFPKIPARSKGLVFWVQSVLVVNGRVLAGTKPLGYSVLGEQRVRPGESPGMKALREILPQMGGPPLGCVPRYSKKNHEVLERWLGKDPKFRFFESPEAGFLWMRAKTGK